MFPIENVNLQKNQSHHLRWSQINQSNKAWEIGRTSYTFNLFFFWINKLQLHFHNKKRSTPKYIKPKTSNSTQVRLKLHPFQLTITGN